MTNEKHTPGPWVNTGRYGEWPNESFHVELRSDTTTCHVAIVDVLNKTRDARERADANAHLIAAAPDLLKACRLAQAVFSNLEPDSFSRIKALVDTAITKAEGR